MEKLLSSQEVAQLLNVSVPHIYRLMQKQNGLKAYKVGRLNRFRLEDVEAYIADQEVKPSEKQPVPQIGRIHYKPGMKVVSL